MKILNTYHIPVPVRDDVKDAGFLAVLTEDAVKDRAVYLGIAGGLDVNAPDYEANRLLAAEWAAHCGQKLNYRAALAYFPILNKSEYRR